MVPLHCCRTREGSERSKENVGQVIPWKPSILWLSTVDSLSFLPPLPTFQTDLPPSHLHPYYNPLYPVPSCSPFPWWLPTLPTVQTPFTQKYLQIFMSSKSLFISLAPLPFLSSSTTAKPLAIYFNPVILVHQMAASAMVGLEPHTWFWARLMLSNCG